MIWVNYDDVVSQITSIGIVLNGGLQIGTRKPVRCKVKGDKEKRGWYRLYELPLEGGGSIITGSFGIWRGDDQGAIKIAIAKGNRQSLNTEQLDAIKARQEADRRRIEAERKQEIEKAANKAAAWWRQCQDNGDAPYLSRKGLPEGRLYGARLSKAGNLVVPIQDGDGKIYGLQVIYHDPKVKERKGRDKDFTPPGLEMKGRYFLIGTPVAGGVLLLCEGVATGATLSEATGLPVVVAFTAGNLQPVAMMLRRRYKGVRVMVCADDDYLGKCKECGAFTLVAAENCGACGKPHGKVNTGIGKAEMAALAVDGGAVCPVFPGERSTDRKGPTDFNDLHTHPDGGLRMVAAQVDAAITATGWSVRGATRAPLPEQGGGGNGGDGRREAVSTLPLDDLVERFIHIDDETGDFVFDDWTRQVCRFAKMIKMLPARVRGDDIKDHPTWKRRAVYIDQIGFDPGDEDKNILCNRWTGWPTVPKAGKCDILLDLLRHLCSREENADEVFRWLLCWLAYPIQKPGAKMHSAVVVHGPQGTGKSRFFEAYAKIYGEYSIVLNQGAIEDKFNADWSERKLFILADEIIARQEMYHTKNMLKNFITGEWVRVNPKNVAAHRERNHMNILFLSNEKQPVVLENDDRRHLVIWTPQPASAAFFAELNAEIDAGGIAALHDYLLKLDLGDFKPWTRPPMTVAKQDLIDINLGSEERFLRDWQAGETEWPFGPCGGMALFAAYRRYCNTHGVSGSRQRESSQFLVGIKKIPGWSNEGRHRFDDAHYIGPTKKHRMVIPAGCEPPAGQSISKWLTDCHLAFAAALEKGAES